MHTDCPLWERAEQDRDASNGDEWSLVERPAVPTPAAESEDIGQYEASLRQGAKVA